MSFTHLHVHSQYSLLDGACNIEPMLDKIQSMGQTACAITDHGVMYGVLDFYKAAKKRGIKPIIGCEVYVAPRSRKEKVHGLDSQRYHLILLCKNETGYKNLIKIVSESFINGFYVKPRVDKELLRQYSDGLIALSGCMFGEVSQNILNGNYETAKETAKWYLNTFGEGNYYIEIQNHGLRDQLTVNDGLMRLSQETGIPLVATNDAHYINKGDSIIQKILVCIQTNHILGEDTGLDFETDEFYLKSEDEMLEAFGFCPQAVLNTEIIANKCSFDFEFGKTKLPHFEIPGNEDHIEYFNRMCLDGLNKKFNNNPPSEYCERLKYELEVINSMGYTDYYLIVQDFINYAKANGIPVGPGRGSGAASLCAYCIGITGIDPLKYKLLFERFLNPERVSMPDFDIDFCYERRGEVIDYVINKYGSDHVAQIATFGTMAARQAVRDVGRVKGVPYGKVDAVAKLIPFELNITISKALEQVKELRILYNTDDTVKEIIDLSMKVEGMPRHVSTHAAGIVITANTVDSYVPLAVNDESVITQFTMKGLEQLGLLKMDFLGLRTLTVISDTEKEIIKNDKDFSIENISLIDEKTFKMFAHADTNGVFQFESGGMKKVLTQLNPQSIEDLIAIISLYRPGPMDSIPQYINNKKNPEKIKYEIPELKEILDVTYGCIVYQEQVMQICRSVAGYTYGRADIVRRAMAKKQHDVMLEERANFINGVYDESGNVICDGALKKGLSEEEAEKLFDSMMSFASYAFNKAHAAAYALVSYRTAYLKCHYTNEFMASLLTSFIDSSSKIGEYIEECQKLGIRIYSPDINIGTDKFIVHRDGIAFCLAAVKNIGRGFIRKIISERNARGKFTDFYDFCERMHGKEFNKRAVESLIKCGAFDSLGNNRKQLLQSMDSIIEGLENEKRNNIAGQIGFYDLENQGESGSISHKFTYPAVEEYSSDELLRMEKDVTGIYLSDHPLKKYDAVAGELKCARLRDVLENDGTFKDGEEVTLLCIIENIRTKNTKNNSEMAFVTLEDTSAAAQILCFPKTFDTYRYRLNPGAVLLFHCKIQLENDNETTVILQSVESVPELKKDESKTNIKHNKSKRLFLRFDSSNSPQVNICENLISIFEGNIPYYFYYNDNQQYKFISKCDGNEILIRELVKILGSDNVIFN